MKMKMTLSLSLWSVALMAVPTSADTTESKPCWQVQLADESRLYVEPVGTQLTIQAEALGGAVSIPVGVIESVKRRVNGGWQVFLTNGDRISGEFGKDPIRVNSLVGGLELSPRHLVGIDAVANELKGEVSQASDLPRVEYGQLVWELWRTGWQLVDGTRLASTRSVRPGFAYGHWASGRGGMALTGNGDESWTDYDVAFDFKMLPANREFFHAHIPGESRGMMVFFRAESLTESWNEPDTGYALALNPSGSWSLLAYEGWHMPGRGWKSEREGKMEKLASGQFDPKDGLGAEGRIILSVKGNTFQAWLNDEPLFDFTHDGVRSEIEPITFGGFGVQWRYESMGWIENLKVEKSARQATRDG